MKLFKGQVKSASFQLAAIFGYLRALSIHKEVSNSSSVALFYKRSLTWRKLSIDLSQSEELLPCLIHIHFCTCIVIGDMYKGYKLANLTNFGVVLVQLI